MAVDREHGGGAGLQSVVHEVRETGMIAERKDAIDADLLAESGDGGAPGQEAGPVRTERPDSPARSQIGREEKDLSEADRPEGRDLGQLDALTAAGLRRAQDRGRGAD